MTIHTRPLNPAEDLPAALALADQSPLGIPHVADWPYRFASWALDDVRNTQAWFDGSRMLGWVVLQTPFWSMDCIAHPDAPASLYDNMLTWAETRAREKSAENSGRPMWFVSSDAACNKQRSVLEAHGFEDVSDEGDDAWSKVLFTIAGDSSMKSTLPLPEGMHIRSLNAGTEIQAYVDLHREVFGSENMTHAWRSRATHIAGYDNDFDLVAVSENGELHGFCVAWLRRLTNGEIAGQIEPLGVRESSRGKHLSQSLLAEAIRRLRSRGAQRIHVETDRQREAAMAAYTSIGFTLTHDVLVYRFVVNQ